MLGNFQHNPGRTEKGARDVEEMVAYFRAAVTSEASKPTEGLINALTTAEIDGDRLSEEEIVANVIVTMVGGQETTTNLIGNGLLTLLRHPDQLERLRSDPTLLESAVEELLRYESPASTPPAWPPPAPPRRQGDPRGGRGDRRDGRGQPGPRALQRP